MANVRTNAPPVQVPATSLSGGAPSGQVGTTVDCCPQAIMFGSGAGAQSVTYGFDTLSNMPPGRRELLTRPGALKSPGNYWDPPTKKKELPQDKETRDGAVWVLVPPGGEVTLTLALLGCSSAANCTYEVVPSTVAEIVGPKPMTDMGALTIKGLAEGEASLKVMCRGQLVGYFHIWCRKFVTIKVGIGAIAVTSAVHRDPQTGAMLKVKKIPVAGAYAKTLQEYLNNVYRQALISFEVGPLGVFDADAAPEPVRKAAQALVFDGPNAIFAPDGGINEALANRDQTFKIWLGSMRELGNLARAQVGSFGRKSIWVLPQPNTNLLRIAGAATGLGEDNVFLFQISGTSANTIAHELGHALGLTHPIAPESENRDHYPEHLRSDRRFRSNETFHPDDPGNVMGNNEPANTSLLYRQWKALPRNLE